MNLRSIWPALLFVATLAFAQGSYVPMPYDVQHYDLALTVTPSDSTIAGVCTISIQSISDTLQNARFDFLGLTADSVSVDGHAAQFAQDSTSLFVHLYLVMPNWTFFVVKISYHGKPTFPNGETWGGFKWGNFKDTTGYLTYTIGVAFTDSLVSMTRRWMPCHDLPDDKATIDYHITVPSPLIVAANGALTGVDSSNGLRTYNWSETDPIATYLMVFDAGMYQQLHFTADSLPVVIYAKATDTADCRKFFGFLDSTLRTFQTRYGPYPFNKIGYALVTLSGGMEHQTMISLGTVLIGNNGYQYLAAHELSHQWWGDMVSPHEFNEAWLCEGFAHFSEAIFFEGLSNHAEYLSSIHGFMNNYFSDAKSEGTFPLYGFPRKPPSSNYPRTIYDKGASVLAMLRWMYGDSLFFASLGTYRQQHQYQSATSRDLQHAFEITVHDTLGWFFNEWVYSAGWPIVRSEVHQSDSIRITLQQLQDLKTQPLFRVPYDIWFILANNDTLNTRIMMEAVDSQLITIPSPGIGIKKYYLDPYYHVLGKHVDTVLTAVEEPAAPPRAESIWLSQNFPNPVVHDAQTIVQVSSEIYSSAVAPQLKLFNTLGREVRDYSSSLKNFQEYIILDLRDLPAGIYHYVLSTPAHSVQKILSLVR